MSYKSTPKVELHLHFEGAAPPDFIRQLAFEQKVDLSKIFNEDGSYKYRDFDHFLEVYEAATSVLKTPEHFARLCSAVLERSAENGVVYCETFLSPDFCGGADVSAWREYLHAIEEAAAKADRDMGITLRGIVTPIRHFGPEQAKKAALCAAETKGDFIVGLGMGGAEMMHRPGDFAYSSEEEKKKIKSIIQNKGYDAVVLTVMKEKQELVKTEIEGSHYAGGTYYGYYPRYYGGFTRFYVNPMSYTTLGNYVEETSTTYTSANYVLETLVFNLDNEADKELVAVVTTRLEEPDNAAEAASTCVKAITKRFN